MNRTARLASLSLALAACDPAAPAVDAGSDAPITDTAITTDAPSSADAPISDAPVSALVEMCQTLAADYAGNCAGSAPRPCIWNGYASLCATGNTQLLVDSMNCLDATTCRTFSDPNEGAACLATEHEAGQTAAVRAALEATCTACGGTGCDMVEATAEILPYLSDADIAAFEDCRGTACSFAELLTNCSSVPSIAAFSACGG